jgi:hypothetical protein
MLPVASEGQLVGLIEEPIVKVCANAPTPISTTRHERKNIFSVKVFFIYKKDC